MGDLANGNLEGGSVLLTAPVRFRFCGHGDIGVLLWWSFIYRSVPRDSGGRWFVVSNLFGGELVVSSVPDELRVGGAAVRDGELVSAMAGVGG